VPGVPPELEQTLRAGLEVIPERRIASAEAFAQALGATLGQAKTEALRERIAGIHPGCIVHAVEEFVDDTNWPALLSWPVDVVVDVAGTFDALIIPTAPALRAYPAALPVGARPSYLHRY